MNSCWLWFVVVSAYGWLVVFGIVCGIWFLGLFLFGWMLIRGGWVWLFAFVYFCLLFVWCLVTVCGLLCTCCTCCLAGLYRVVCLVVGCFAVKCGLNNSVVWLFMFTWFVYIVVICLFKLVSYVVYLCIAIWVSFCVCFVYWLWFNLYCDFEWLFVILYWFCWQRCLLDVLFVFKFVLIWFVGYWLCDLCCIVVTALVWMLWGWYKTEFDCLLLLVSFCLFGLVAFGMLIACYAVLISCCYDLV